MKDETYVYIHDVKDKKFTARSANKKRTHNGKGGRVRFPSDNLSKKELQKMNGECKSFKLNSPMTWNEFMSMPDDIKITYIKLLREKFDVTDTALYKMFGTNKDSLSRTLLKLGLRVPKRSTHREWKKEEWFAWVNGVDKLPAPVIEEPVQTEEPEAFVEDDLPYEEPDPITLEEAKESVKEHQAIPVAAVPKNGSMTFTCPANQALNTLGQLLGDANVSISVMWRVIEEGGDDDGN